MQPTVRKLKRADLALAEIGFGASVLGNLYRPMEDVEARATLDAALDNGLRYIDTAPHYGRGLSERRVGDAVRGRDAIVVSTKVGRILSPDPSIRDAGERDCFFSNMPFSASYDYSHDAILRSYEASLHRMGLARIDLLLVHDIGRLTHGDRHAFHWDQLTRGGGFDALRSLRDQGAIAGFGLGVNEIEVAADAIRAADLDVLLLAGRYTLLEQGALDTLLPGCVEADVSVIVGGPYNSGILAGDSSGGTAHYNYAPAPPAVVERVGRLRAVAQSHGVPLAAAALQFPLAHPAVASVVPGLGSPGQVNDTLQLYRTPIPASFWEELKHEGLVRPYAPVPADSQTR